MVIWEVDDNDKKIEGVDEFGRPDPAYAAALGLIRAPFGRRMLALVLDAVLYLVLQVPYWVFALPLLLKLYLGKISWYGFVNHPSFILAIVGAGLSFILTLAYCVVQLVMHGRKGTTVGKGLMGLRSVNVKTLERPGVGRVLVRVLVVSGSTLVVVGPLLFLLSPLFDSEKRGRGWHDLVGKLWLIDVRKGLQPYDEKRMRIARKMVTVEPVAQAKEMPSLATPSAQGGEGEYRPGGRVSAGVLGAARPHGAGPRPEVGIGGLDSGAAQPAPVAAPGQPVVGAYRPSSSPAAAPAAQPPAAPPAQPAASAPPAQPSWPQGQQAPPQPVAPASPQAPASPAPYPSAAAPAAPPEQHQAARSANLADAAGREEMVTGTPWSRPEPPVEHTRMRAPEGFALHVDNGERIPITEALVLGRNPAGDEPGVRPLAVTDETRSVSKTHFSVRPVDQGVEVTDRRSTNGTAVLHDGVEQPVAAGSTVLALPGDTIRFGDRTAVVERT